jgi:hypothetical protein
MDPRITGEWGIRSPSTGDIVACDSQSEARVMMADAADGELIVRKVYETTWADDGHGSLCQDAWHYDSFSGAGRRGSVDWAGRGCGRCALNRCFRVGPGSARRPQASQA